MHRFALSLCASIAISSATYSCLTSTQPADTSTKSAHTVIPPHPNEHAIWITRWDYRTPDDITHIAENCQSAGIDTLLFQVRGNATSFYRSTLEPWAEQFEFKDPGFDPLSLMIAAAHAHHLRLVAWVNVMPAWYGLTPPKSPDHVWNKHPEWTWFDQKGARQSFTEKFYVSLNPCLPEVRTYLVSVIDEIVTHYDIDGLHLDYIRFPNENPAIPTGSGIDYPRDAKTLSLFKQATGKSPDDDHPLWDRWRTDQVTTLVRQIRTIVRTHKPDIEMTAAVGVTRANALTHFQDADRWLTEDLVDGVYPMNYTSDPKLFAKRCEAWKSAAKSRRVVMGVMFEKAPNAVLQVEVQRALEGFQGFSIFAYGSLFETPNDAVDRPDAASRAQRDALRQAALPWLRAAKPSAAR